MRILFILIGCFHFIFAMAGNYSHRQSTAVFSTAVDFRDSVQESADTIPALPLPSVPPSLQTAKERADYIITHFWDAMDFCDTRRSCNAMFMEQNFSNFISVFPYANESAHTTAISTLMLKAEANSEAYTLLADIAEKYLYNLDSPVYSEDYYLLFLRHILASDMMANDPNNARLKFRWDALNKNRSGMLAADFAYTTPNGTAATLHTFPTPSHLLLIFYDPDCEHCKEVMNELQNNQLLSSAISSGKLQILAIYSGDDYDLWKKTAHLLPKEWNVGYDSGTLQENGSYVIRTLPTLYLLDYNKKVLLKETSISSILSELDIKTVP